MNRSSTETRILTLLALLSGCCALAYEILYMRGLTTILGDMLYVHAALLATFLVGIGAGAKLAHWCVRWLWALEVLTGLYALAFPALSRALSRQGLMADIAASPTWTITTTIAFLCLPSLAIGFSIPLFSAYIKHRAEDKLSFQGVYIAYNLGAVLSILAVEFLLVRYLGISRSLATIGAINLFNGLVLLAMRGAPRVLTDKRPRQFPRRIVVALALASVASAAFQMFFLKLTYLVFSPHRENFAVGLSVTMLGIFLGAWLASKIRTSFATILALVPISIGGVYLFFLQIVRFYQATFPQQASSEWVLLAHKVGVSCLFALAPMILFGATLPALMRTEDEVAGEAGHLLWISSLANAAGYLIYVLFAHPLMSSGAMLALASAVTLLGSWIAVRGSWSRRQLALALVGAVLVVAMAVRWEDKNFYLAQWFEDLYPEDEVIIYKSGAESATLLRTESDEWVSYNGHSSIWVQRDGIVTIPEMVSGVIPALSAPTFGRAMVLGLGTGITAGATARIFEHTDVVEINDAFYKMMPDIHYANLDLGENESATRWLTDGRSFLIGRHGRYDAIVNSIPAPTYYSASKIYTVEFYERIVKALKPDGVFCTWLAVPNMSEQGVQTILSALRRSFRYCDLRLMGSGYYSSTCSNVPIRARSLSAVPAQLVLIDALQKGLAGFDLTEYFDDIRLSENVFERFEPDVSRQNTDDHPVLEFMVVRNFQLGQQGRDPFVYDQELMNIDPVRPAEIDNPARLERRARVFRFLESPLYELNFLPRLKDVSQLH